MPRTEQEYPPNATDARLLGWLSEAVTEGEAFLRSQPAYRYTTEIIDTIMSENREPVAPSLSDITENRVGKVALDLASGLTDVKPFWDYKTFNRKFEAQAVMGNKLATSWWANRYIDLKFMGVIQYCLAGASSYAHIVWNDVIGDQDMLAEDPRDVLPIRPSSLVSIQDAYGVIIRRERTVNYVRALYPDVPPSLIAADREGSRAVMEREAQAASWLEKLGQAISPFWNAQERSHTRLRVPVLDLYTCYVKDPRMNTKEDMGELFTNRPVQVGESGRNWSYTVDVGQPLYPRGRCITFTKRVVLRDGPNIYWHGLFPCPKLTLDPWPWTWLGKSPLRDILPLYRELNRLLRIRSNHNQRVGRPGVIADKNAIGRAELNKIDTARAGLKARVNPVAGKGFELQYEPPLDGSIQLSIQDLRDQIDFLSGTRDLSQLLRLGQVPTADTVDKIMEAMSPAIRLRSRVMEAFLREVATIVLSNFFQFYSTARRVAVLGPSGLTFQDFDFDPDTLIPDFLTEEDERKGIIRPRAERAIAFLQNFAYHVAPGSLLQAASISRKLLYIQLARAGFMDIVSTLEELEIPNVGAPADLPTSVIGRLLWQQEHGIGMSVSPAGRKSTAQTMPTVDATTGAIRESPK